MEANTMRNSKKTIFLLISLIVVFLQLSCSVIPKRLKPLQVIVQPGSESVRERQNTSVAKRFQESAPEKPTVVESAMELSNKYAELSRETGVLQKRNEYLVSKNKQLEEQIATLQEQLQQTKRELTEATDFLITMQVDLNNWKTDIIGFRDEMRDAETAQLEALLKILRVLGGEVGTKSAGAKETESTVASLGKID